MRFAFASVFSVAAVLAFLAATTEAAARESRLPEPRQVPELHDAARLPAPDLTPSRTPTDSLYLLGGPGILSGKFQDAAGLPDRQGWTGIDLNQVTETYWQVSSFNAANLDPGTPGNRAWWCGTVLAPCNAGDPAEGYGPGWAEYLDWYGTVSAPDSAVTVRVQAVINYDIEPGEDYLFLQVEYPEWMENLRTFSWSDVAAEVVDVTFTLTPDQYVGDAGDQVHLRWSFYSDGAWDDADCLWPTAGAAQIDLIQVHFDQGTGPVPVGTTETCEEGDPLQWVPTLPRGPGDFSKVWPRLDDADPVADNATPQFAFIDDGLVVPGTGGYPCTTHCYGPGGFIVNPEAGISDLGLPIDNEIWSPMLPVPAGDWNGALFSFDHYVHAELADGGPYVLGQWHVRSTADPAGLTGWSAWQNRNTALYGRARYVREIQNVSDLLVPGFTHVQLALGVRNYYPFYGEDGTPAPYFDNVSLKVYRKVGPSALLVRPDGSGDYATIQLAIDAAADQDTVLLADGIFTGEGNRDLSFLGKEIVVCSRSGRPENCILDVAGSAADPHRGVVFQHEEGPGSVLSGLTITAGYLEGAQTNFSSSGGAVFCATGSAPTIENCIFRGNSARGPDQQGGAIFCFAASPVIRDCVFDGNTGQNGGALGAAGNISPAIVATPVVTNCLFVGNEGLVFGGAVFADRNRAHLTISSCTFTGNVNPASNGALVSYFGGRIDIDHSIIAFNGPGYGVTTTDTTDVHFTCSTIHGNTKGDWYGPFASQLGVSGNLDLDPLFCLDSNPDLPYGLHADSPCAPDSNSNCGLVGYAPVGCAAVSAVAELPVAGERARLLPCYPNPFNPQTTISFTLPAPEHVALRIYGLDGKLVRQLANASFPSGRHEVLWDGRDDRGHAVASGVFFCRLDGASADDAIRMVLVK